VRQLCATDDASPALAAWIAVHERSDRVEPEDEDDPHEQG
jgi:hypothetical protein